MKKPSLMDVLAYSVVALVLLSTAAGKPFIPDGPPWFNYVSGGCWLFLAACRLHDWLAALWRAPKVGNSEGAGR